MLLIKASAFIWEEIFLFLLTLIFMLAITFCFSTSRSNSRFSVASRFKGMAHDTHDHFPSCFSRKHMEPTQRYVICQWTSGWKHPSAAVRTTYPQRVFLFYLSHILDLPPSPTPYIKVGSAFTVTYHQTSRTTVRNLGHFYFSSKIIWKFLSALVGKLVLL